MDNKQIGVIMMAVGGVVVASALGLLIKWYPIHVSVIVAGVGLGFGGYTVYKKS